MYIGARRVIVKTQTPSLPGFSMLQEWNCEEDGRRKHANASSEGGFKNQEEESRLSSVVFVVKKKRKREPRTSSTTAKQHKPVDTT